VTLAILSVAWCGYLGYTKWVSMPPIPVMSAAELEDPLADSSTNMLGGVDLARVWPIAGPVLITLLVLIVAGGREWGLTAIGALILGIFSFASGVPVGMAYAPAIAAAAMAAILGAALE
jgi:hypothetical protein